MRLNVSFHPLPVCELEPLREEHLAGLPHGQELLLEVMVSAARGVGIYTRGAQLCGHALVHGEGTLIEFHLRREYWLYAEQVLLRLVRTLELKRALVKSFDGLLLSSAIAHHTGLRSLGLLVRDYVPRPLPPPGRITYVARVGTPADYERVRRVRQGVFDRPERLRLVLERGWMRLFEKEPARGGGPIGFGILRPVVANRPEVDVSIALDASCRGRGHATYMLRDLAEECVAAGKSPICGCAEENHASRHLGERIGFVARHRLLELSF